MNCHENNNKKQGAHKHSPLNHMLHMVICCGLPIVIVGFLPLIAKLSPGAGSLVAKIVPFLCPIMMVSMMLPMMLGSKKKDCCSNANTESDNNDLNSTAN
jgi:branched-subunit amino acid transport protein